MLREFINGHWSLGVIWIFSILMNVWMRYIVKQDYIKQKDNDAKNKIHQRKMALNDHHVVAKELEFF